MSMLIKGMEKPKDCGVCPFELDGWPDEYVEICKLLDRQVGYFGEESGIPSDCPIMEVPEAITDKLALIYESAKLSDFIRKPWAWTLYYTWKWCDQHETERGEA